MRIQIKVNQAKTQAVSDYLKQRFPELVSKGLESGVMVFMNQLQNRVVEKLTGIVLHIRTGTLRRSITNQVFRSGPKIIGKIGSNLVYARIHEFGGIIRAKNK